MKLCSVTGALQDVLLNSFHLDFPVKSFCEMINLPFAPQPIKLLFSFKIKIMPDFFPLTYIDWNL